MKNANQARAVTDGALVDHGQKALLRHPRHLVGFVKIRRRTDVVSTSSNEDVVLAVSDADSWLELERLLDLAEHPSRFLPDLSKRGLHRLFRGFDDADRHLPAPAVVDEAMASEHQQTLRVVDDEHDRDSLHAQHVMLEASTSRRLDVDELQIHPPTLVQSPRAEDLPASAGRVLVAYHHVSTLLPPLASSEVDKVAAPGSNKSPLSALGHNPQRRSRRDRSTRVHLMPVLTTSQRVHELLTVLGENASAWFDFDEQLTAFQALDEFTLHGRRHRRALVRRRIQATDPGHRPDRTPGMPRRHCSATPVELQDALRYSRVLDLVAPLLPRRADG